MSTSEENLDFESKRPYEVRMKSLENYFKSHIKDDEAFIPEYEAAKKINAIALKEQLQEEGLVEIVRIFNEANLKPHYSGSGWFDFRLHLTTLIGKNGFDHRDLPNNNIELIPIK